MKKVLSYVVIVAAEDDNTLNPPQPIISSVAGRLQVPMGTLETPIGATG
jgi:hypothetical protein